MAYVATLAKNHEILRPIVPHHFVDVMRHQHLRGVAIHTLIPVSLQNQWAHQVEPQGIALPVRVMRIQCTYHPLAVRAARTLTGAVLTPA